MLITGSLMWALALAVPNPSFGFSAGPLVAIVLASVGAAIAILGVVEFRSAGTTVDPRVPDQSMTLVIGGVYRFSRNPMYLGFLLVLSSWDVYLGSVPALFMLPAFVFYMNRFQIVPEERYMKEKFGDSFRRYTETVRRWV
jgi:protein-S-isoprenylcysteine O-methyltransferase Ste14